VTVTRTDGRGAESKSTERLKYDVLTIMITVLERNACAHTRRTHLDSEAITATDLQQGVRRLDRPPQLSATGGTKCHEVNYCRHPRQILPSVPGRCVTGSVV